jgi:sugar lactone lactonase YvrE
MHLPAEPAPPHVENMPSPRSLLALFALSLPACADDPVGPSADRVELPGGSFYPEGVAFDRDGGMFVSSILTGQIAHVDAGASTATSFVEAGTLGPSTVAMLASQRGDLLWVCLGTFGTALPPAVIGLDVHSGAERVRHHFPPQHDGRTSGLCNEVAEDADGNVYASDSFGARVLRIAAADRTTPDHATTWAEGPELAATSFGINGIAFDRDAALLAVNTTTGALLRIDLETAAIKAVPLERPLAGPDGIRVASPARAIVVEQTTGSVSSIDLRSGAIKTLTTGLREPTSLDVIDDVAWVSEGQLHHLFDMTAPELPFFVVRVPL